MSLTHRATFVVRSHWNHWPFQEVWIAVRTYLPLFASIVHAGYRIRVPSVESYAAGVVVFALGALGSWFLIESAAVRYAAANREELES